MTGSLFHYLPMAQSIHNGAHARAAVSGPVTIVLERSGQYSHMVSPESARGIKTGCELRGS